jgi:hypothetical protein
LTPVDYRSTFDKNSAKSVVWIAAPQWAQVRREATVVFGEI